MNTQIILSIFNILLFCSTAVVIAQEQAPAPTHKEGDTWQFSISRKGGAVSSTELNDGTYELVFTQGNVKLFEVSGNQKTEIEAKADGGPTQALLSLVGKSDQRPGSKISALGRTKVELRVPNSTCGLAPGSKEICRNHRGRYGESDYTCGSFRCLQTGKKRKLVNGQRCGKRRKFSHLLLQSGNA